MHAFIFSVQCKENEFRCDNDKKCINLSLICDGTNDCLDETDELHPTCSTFFIYYF